MSDSRIIYLDILRIIATFSVIVLHVSAAFWYTNPQLLLWKIANAFDSFSRFGVPVFYMISGALFLDINRDLHYKRILLKNIPRLLAAYIFWSMLYGAIRSNDVSFWLDFFMQPYHLWFLPSLIGIYLVAPVFKLIADKKDIFKYLLALFFVFAIVLPTLRSIPELKYIVGWLDRFSNKIWYFRRFIFCLDIGLIYWFSIKKYTSFCVDCNWQRHSNLHINFSSLAGGRESCWYIFQQ